MGIPLFFGGGLNACPDGLGHLLREELSKFKRASACFGGIVIQYYLKFPLPPIVAGLSPSNLKDREVQHKKTVLSNGQILLK